MGTPRSSRYLLRLIEIFLRCCASTIDEVAAFIQRRHPKHLSEIAPIPAGFTTERDWGVGHSRARKLSYFRESTD